MCGRDGITEEERRGEYNFESTGCAFRVDGYIYTSLVEKLKCTYRYFLFGGCLLMFTFRMLSELFLRCVKCWGPQTSLLCNKHQSYVLQMLCCSKQTGVTCCLTRIIGELIQLLPRGQAHYQQVDYSQSCQNIN